MEKRIYKCTICGKEDYWGDSWGRYGSYVMEEECPDDMPIGCSDKCQDEITEAIKTGRFCLPELKSDGWAGSKVIVGRRGY